MHPNKGPIEPVMTGVSLVLPHPTGCQDAKKRAEILIQNQLGIGAPEEIRTPDPQIRSLIIFNSLTFLDFH
jgi:hypothetical protein